MFNQIRHNRSHSHLGPQKQQGVALIFTAFIMVALVTALALAVDVGRLYAAQQDLQTAANLAAIDAARVASGCATGVPANRQAAAQNAVNLSIARNFNNREEDTVPTANVVLGAAQEDPTTPNLRVFTANANLPAPAPGQQTASDTAVRVTLTDPVPPNLFPIFPSTTLSATASAQNNPQATIRAGSSLLTIDGGLLSQLGIGNIGVFDQGSLADVNVGLGDLALELGVGTPDDLLTTNLPLQDLISGINTVSDGALGGLAGALSTDLAGTNVTLGDVLNSAGPVGQTVQVGAQSLADALVQLAMSEREDPLEVNLPLAIPGLSSTTARIRILEPPQFDIGRPGLDGTGAPFTVATSGQVLVELTLGLSVLGIVDVLELPIFIRGGFSRAELINIFCANSQQPFHRAVVDGFAESARLGVGRFDDLTATNPMPDPMSSVTILGIDIPISANPPALGNDSGTFLFDFPPAPGVENTAMLNGGARPLNLIAGLLTSVQLGSGGGLLNVLLNTVLGLLRPLLDTVAGALTALAPVDDLLSDLLTGLGVNLGPAEISLDAVDVNQPELFEATARNPATDDEGTSAGGTPALGST